MRQSLPLSLKSSPQGNAAPEEIRPPQFGAASTGFSLLDLGITDRHGGVGDRSNLDGFSCFCSSN